MFCDNCGAHMEEGAQFCVNCGAKVEVRSEPQPTVLIDQTNYEQPPQNNQQQQIHQQYSNKYTVPNYETPKKLGSNVPIIIAIVCGILAIALVVATVVFWDDIPGIFGGQRSWEYDNDDASGREEYVQLHINDYPTEVYTDIVSVSGTIFTSKNRAELELDGEMIETVVKSEGVLEWSTDLYLEEGENTFKFTLVDKEGNSQTKTVTINYVYSWPFPVGTELIRTYEYPTSRIFVRPGPGKNSGDPIMAITPNDYVTTLVYTGNNQYHYDAGNGYHYWYEVTLPNGTRGWIRDDMVQLKYGY